MAGGAAGLSFPAAAAAGEAERAWIAAATRPAQDFSKAERYEMRPGGAATAFRTFNRDSFSQPSANMSFKRELDFRIGNGVFRKVWVSAPTSTKSSDGLGPLFSARSCQRCHLKDGRGHPPAPGARAESTILKLSDPVYGGQLQNFAIQGAKAEGEATGREWRTPPLWGIGLTETVSGHTPFLHDGRARNLLEAILWHGGEAEASRDRVAAMTRGLARPLLPRPLRRGAAGRLRLSAGRTLGRIASGAFAPAR